MYLCLNVLMQENIKINLMLYSILELKCSTSYMIVYEFYA